MFHSFFKKDPMNGVEGRRYRHTMLEPGAAKDEMETLVEFLGRKPNSRAFLVDIGLGPET